jgi:glucose-1-phosphate cytidylyltransferase
MKVVILAGGLGTRLGGLTEATPKPMLRIGSRPLLWHIMRIHAHYGLRQFVLCLGYRADQVKEYFLNYDIYNGDVTMNLARGEFRLHACSRAEDWDVTLADTGLNTLKGGRLKRVERHLDDDVNLLTYGDGVADIDIGALLSYHHRHGRLLTVTGVRPPSRFGEIRCEDGLVTGFTEKPQTSEGLINGGFMVFHRRLLERLVPDEGCDLEYGIFERLAREREIAVYTHPGQWACVDTERDLDHLNRLWSRGQAFWRIWS